MSVIATLNRNETRDLRSSLRDVFEHVRKNDATLNNAFAERFPTFEKMLVEFPKANSEHTTRSLIASEVGQAVEELLQTPGISAEHKQRFYDATFGSMEKAMEKRQGTSVWWRHWKDMLDTRYNFGFQLDGGYHPIQHGYSRPMSRMTAGFKIATGALLGIGGVYESYRTANSVLGEVNPETGAAQDINWGRVALHAGLATTALMCGHRLAFGTFNIMPMKAKHFDAIAKRAEHMAPDTVKNEIAAETALREGTGVKPPKDRSGPDRA